MAVSPEVLVVLFDGISDVPQTVGWNHERQLALFATPLFKSVGNGTAKWPEELLKNP